VCGDGGRRGRSQHAAVIGAPVLQGGIEIVPATLDGVEVDRLTTRGADSLGPSGHGLT